MKKKVLIGMALLLVVPLLASCGGVAQEDLDAAESDLAAAEAQVASLQSQLGAAQSDLDAAESDLAAAESELATAESDLSAANAAKATAQSALAAAEAEIAELEAAAEEEEVAEEEEEVAEEEEEVAEEEEEEAVTELSFTPATYTNDEYGFTIQYLDSWAQTDPASLDSYIVQFASAAYNVPGFFIIGLDASEADTLEEALALGLEDPATDVQSTGEATLSDGTAVTTAWFFYKSESGTGTDLEAQAYGFVKDDKWFILVVYTIGSYWPMDDQYPDEILSTWTFE